jgi:hypothetical protein
MRRGEMTSSKFCEVFVKDVVEEKLHIKDIKWP